MFQVEPILWLQATLPGVLSWILFAITELGRAPVYVAILFIVGFGFRLRASLALLILLAINGVLTETAKTSFGLPRPRHVEVAVDRPHRPDVIALTDDGGAPDFWSLPTGEAITAVRAAEPAVNFGMPSGHVSTAVIFPLGLLIFFRLRWAVWLAAGWVPAMMLSRMFMGAHFLADTLGGLVVGGVAVVLTNWLLGPLGDDRRPEPTLSDLIPLALASLALLIAGPLILQIDALNAGRVVGLVVGYAVLIRLGFPGDEGALMHRAARIAMAVGLYLGSDYAIGLALDQVGWSEARVGHLITPAIGLVVTFVGTVWLSRRLGEYNSA